MRRVPHKMLATVSCMQAGKVRNPCLDLESSQGRACLRGSCVSALHGNASVQQSHHCGKKFIELV